MTLTDKAAQYAKQHPQEVTLTWIDNSTRIYDADKAVRLCATSRTAACIMSAEAPDKALADMLNRLLDDE